MNPYQELPLDEIKINPVGRRPLSGQKVKELQESISEVGLLSPLNINSENNTLVAGRHRLEAVKKLRWKTVPCVLTSYSDIDAKLAEISENLKRNNLTELERVIYEAQYNKLIKEKRNQSNGKGAAQLISTRAEETRKQEQTVRNEIALGKKLLAKLSPDVQSLIRDTRLADNKLQLGKLAELSEDQQLEVATKVNEKQAKNVDEAIRVINRENSHAGADLQNESDAAKFIKLFEQIEPKMRKFLEKDCLNRLLKIWTDEKKIEARDIVMNIRDHAEKIIDKISYNLD